MSRSVGRTDRRGNPGLVLRRPPDEGMPRHLIRFINWLSEELMRSAADIPPDAMQLLVIALPLYLDDSRQYAACFQLLLGHDTSEGSQHEAIMP